ncbi:MAG: hypothetical protein AAGD01_01905 [Acidobacteriota bacterium]
MSWRSLLLAVVAATLVHLGLTRWWGDFPRFLDVFLVVTVLHALAGRSLPALLGGMLCGLAHDVWSGEPFALQGFANTFAGYVTARLAQRLTARTTAGLAGIVAIGVVVHQLAVITLRWAIIPDSALPHFGWLFLRIGATALAVLFFSELSERALSRIKHQRLQRPGRLRWNG